MFTAFSAEPNVQTFGACEPEPTEMDILPTAMTLARWGAYLGLACGLIYAVGGFFYDLFTRGLNWGTAMAFMAIVGMPVLFGAFGFVLGALIALLLGGRS